VLWAERLASTRRAGRSSRGPRCDRQGKPVGLIDWEQARPGRRVEDVANLCWSFVEPTPQSECREVGKRWRLIADDYGLDSRDDLVTTVLARMSTCAEDIVREPLVDRCAIVVSPRGGDHVMIRAMQEWVAGHEQALRAVVHD
jgi:Phosphotransferase enzyme family